MIAFYHRQITREALEQKVSPAALKLIVKANLGQDRLSGQIGHPEFHFDDNAFLAGQSYMDERRVLAISAFKQRDLSLAWKAIGQLTHCAQDFYAHSNYVSLYKERHSASEMAEIDPLDPDILAHPGLHSGCIYYPWELLTYLPGLGKVFRNLIPHDSHAWMNLDSPASGSLFEWARVAAIRRTTIEFDQVMAQSCLEYN